MKMIMTTIAIEAGAGAGAAAGTETGTDTGTRTRTGTGTGTRTGAGAKLAGARANSITPNTELPQTRKHSDVSRRSSHLSYRDRIDYIVPYSRRSSKVIGLPAVNHGSHDHKHESMIIAHIPGNPDRDKPKPHPQISRRKAKTETEIEVQPMSMPTPPPVIPLSAPSLPSWKSDMTGDNDGDMDGEGADNVVRSQSLHGSYRNNHGNNGMEEVTYQMNMSDKNGRKMKNMKHMQQHMRGKRFIRRDASRYVYSGRDGDDDMDQEMEEMLSSDGDNESMYISQEKDGGTVGQKVV